MQLMEIRWEHRHGSSTAKPPQCSISIPSLKTNAVSLIARLVGDGFLKFLVADCVRRVHCLGAFGALKCIGVATVAAIQRSCPSDK
jgi:hypothetical protein